MPADWIDEHAVNQTLADLQEAAGAARERLHSESDPAPEAQETIKRAASLGIYLQVALPQADRDLTLRTAVSTVETEVAEIARLLNTYVGDGNTGHLTNAANNLRNAIQALPGILFPTALVDADATRAALEAAANEIRSQLDALAPQAESLADGFGRIEAKYEHLLETAAAVEEQIASANESLTAASETAISAVKSEGETARSTIQPALEGAISAHESATAAAIKEFEADSIAAIKKSGEDWQVARTEAETEASEHLAKLESLRDEAVNLVEVIGRTGMTAGYQQDAKAEGEAAEEWRKYAVWFGLGAALVLVVAVAWGMVGETSSELLIAKGLLSAALGALATYAAKQARDHRERSRRSRNLELALASLGPYLESLDGDKKQDVKQAFAYLFFAPLNDSPDLGEETPLASAPVRELLRKIGTKQS